MKNVTINDGYGKPEAYICKQKQRIKQHNVEKHFSGNSTQGKVYLKDGDNFEIELFNPTQEKILAEIELNGKRTGSGIVLRPGERVFLERHIDDQKKLVFDTYDVNSSDKAAMNAIEKNGKVKILFKKEKVTLTWGGSSVTWTTYPNIYNTQDYTTPYWKTNPTITCDCTTRNAYYSTTVLDGTISVKGTYTSASLLDDGSVIYDNSLKNQLNNKTTETGRVEKGEKSNQDFTYDSSNFETFSFYQFDWTILPESRKPVVKEDLVLYCAGCGRRKREKERFCPSCGRKL